MDKNTVKKERKFRIRKDSGIEIQVRMPKSMKQVLMQDAELFELKTNSGIPNCSELVRCIVRNYNELFSERMDDLVDRLNSRLNEFSDISIENKRELSYIFMEIMSGSDIEENISGTRISIKLDEDLYDIITSQSKNYAIEKSAYIRGIIQEYLSLTRYEREKIIFKENYDIIKHAKNKRHLLSFSTKTSDTSDLLVEPYEISPSTDEQCGYLLCRNVENGYII